MTKMGQKSRFSAGFSDWTFFRNRGENVKKCQAARNISVDYFDCFVASDLDDMCIMWLGYSMHHQLTALCVLKMYHVKHGKLCAN